MKDTKRKHLNNIKNLREENINLRIDKEVMRKQLISVRNTINEILGENKGVDMISGKYEPENMGLMMKEYFNRYFGGMDELNKKGQEAKKKVDLVEDDKGNIKVVEQATQTQTETKPDQSAEAKEKEQPKPSKCHNCQALGIYKKGFCFKCLNEGKTDIKDAKTTPEQLTFKCSKCGADGDDEGSFKTRNGKMFCIDCLGDAVGWKAEKK